MSLMVQVLPSSHSVPSDRATWTHWWLTGLQESVVQVLLSSQLAGHAPPSMAGASISGASMAASGLDPLALLWQPALPNSHIARHHATPILVCRKLIRCEFM
jgi:hypothetical protein